MHASSFYTTSFTFPADKRNKFVNLNSSLVLKRNLNDTQGLPRVDEILGVIGELLCLAMFWFRLFSMSCIRRTIMRIKLIQTNVEQIIIQRHSII